MGDEEVEYKAEYLDTAEDAEPEVWKIFAVVFRTHRPNPVGKQQGVLEPHANQITLEESVCMLRPCSPWFIANGCRPAVGSRQES